MDEPIHLDLTKAEAISLHRMANLWSSVLLDALAEPPEGCTVLPLESAAMKLEVILRCEGVEL